MIFRSRNRWKISKSAQVLLFSSGEKMREPSRLNGVRRSIHTSDIKVSMILLFL